MSIRTHNQNYIVENMAISQSDYETESMSNEATGIL